MNQSGLSLQQAHSITRGRVKSQALLGLLGLLLAMLVAGCGTSPTSVSPASGVPGSVDTGAASASDQGSTPSDALVVDALRHAYAMWPEYFVIGKLSPTEAEMDQGAIVGVSTVRFEPHRKIIAPGGVQRNGTMYPMEVTVRFSKGHAATYNVNLFRNDSDGAFLISVNNTGWNRVPSLGATP